MYKKHPGGNPLRDIGWPMTSGLPPAPTLWLSVQKTGISN
jgi:hypothetical protein